MAEQIKCWTIALAKDVSGPQTPVFFYNHKTDIWVRTFENGCAFLQKKEAYDMLDALCVDAEVFSGHINM